MDLMIKRSGIAAALLFTLFTAFANFASAQNYAEWFRQKKTQQRYLLEQIAALKGYALVLKKGYQLASTGVNTMKEISKGEFDFHRNFFSTLKTISPVVAKNPKLTEVMSMQIEVIRLASEFTNIASANPAHKNYAQAVKRGLLAKTLDAVDHLLSIVTADKIQMGESQRLQRLDAIHTSMSELVAFSRYFLLEVNALDEQRKWETLNLEKVRKLYEN